MGLDSILVYQLTFLGLSFLSFGGWLTRLHTLPSEPLCTWRALRCQSASCVRVMRTSLFLCLQSVTLEVDLCLTLMYLLCPLMDSWGGGGCPFCWEAWTSPQHCSVMNIYFMLLSWKCSEASLLMSLWCQLSLKFGSERMLWRHLGRLMWSLSVGQKSRERAGRLYCTDCFVHTGLRRFSGVLRDGTNWCCCRRIVLGVLKLSPEVLRDWAVSSRF